MRSLKPAIAATFLLLPACSIHCNGDEKIINVHLIIEGEGTVDESTSHGAVGSCKSTTAGGISGGACDTSLDQDFVSTATLTATPAAGWKFAGWSITNSGSFTPSKPYTSSDPTVRVSSLDDDSDAAITATATFVTDTCDGGDCSDGGIDAGSIDGGCTEQLGDNSIDAEPGSTESVADSPECTGNDDIESCEGEGYPDGVTVYEDPGTVTLAVTSSVAVGTYPGNVNFTFLDGSHQTIPLTVVVGNPSISIAATPPSLVVSPGGTATASIAVTRRFGATGAVTVTPSNFPTDVTASAIVIAADAGTADLTFTATGGAPLTGSAVNVALAAVDGTLHDNETLPVSVAPPPPGSLDTDFGVSGITTMNITSGSVDVVYGAALAASDAIVVVGATTPSGGNNSSAFVARFTSAGVLDTTFNTTGIRTFNWGTGSDAAHAVIVNSDQSIVVIGQASLGTADIGVAKFTSAGAFDTSFGNSNGMTVGGISFGVGFGGLVQSDNKIVAVGYGNYSGPVLVAERFLADGSLADNTFGIVNGAHSLGYQKVPAGSGSSGSYAEAVTLNGSNQLVIAGYEGTRSVNSKALLVQLNTDGTLDDNFGASGMLEISPASSALVAYAVAMQSSNVLLAGQVYSGGNRFLNVRATSSGALDTQFGTTGIISTSFPSTGFSASQAAAMAIDSNGKIITVGQTTAADDKQNVGVARMSGTDGSLDATFDGASGAGNGLVAIPISSGADAASAVVLQSTGDIVLAGTANSGGSGGSVFVARVLP